MGSISTGCFARAIVDTGVDIIVIANINFYEFNFFYLSHPGYVKRKGYFISLYFSDLLYRWSRED